MTITHIVLFQFKSDVTPETINDVRFTTNVHYFINAGILTSQDNRTHALSQGVLCSPKDPEAIYQSIVRWNR
jgi:hypothetical protein